MREELEALARDPSIALYVDFLGIRRDVAVVAAASDVFVLPSAWSGLGFVGAEAIAYAEACSSYG